MDADKSRGESACEEAHEEAADVPKSWREGMEMKQGDDPAAKTVFISQNLNKQYEERERRGERATYERGAAKIAREMDYFAAILARVGRDLRDAEAHASRDLVLERRRLIRRKIDELKRGMDAFAADALEGEPSERARPEPDAGVLDAVAEFAFLGEKKAPGAGVAFRSVCVDCDTDIVPVEGKDAEAAALAHAQTERHKACAPEPPPPRKSALAQALAAAAAVEKAGDGDKKGGGGGENLKKSPVLRLNRISYNLMDDNASCEVCDASFPSGGQDIFKHMGESSHKEKLNAFNAAAQKTIVERNPEAFGEGGQFQLTSAHTDLHKIFVDPSIKQAYCGLCCRQLPFSQSNIDEHVSSVKHDKLLVEAVEGDCAEFLALGVDPELLAAVKSRAPPPRPPSPEPLAAKEIKPKMPPPHQQQQQQSSTPKDDGAFLDAADIQNMRKVLPDKPIRSIPELLDGNNVPIHLMDQHCDQPELKKFLADNGVLRQPNGRFKCQTCPQLEIPNGRMAFRHASKHRAGAANSQFFDNWKRQPNRQQGYGNEQKSGRVVMHKNGVNYWCTSCRLPLIDASTAFAHVKTDNHHMFVDGVSFSSGTIFDCVSCKTTINGEKNACQHLVATKHRENSKLDAMAKQEGRLSMMEERKQKHNRREKPAGEYESSVSVEEERLFEKNGVAYSHDSGLYRCAHCGWVNKKRAEMLSHVFSYEHTSCLAKQGR